jgi:TRAP transporter TAXI family solute receptor
MRNSLNTFVLLLVFAVPGLQTIQAQNAPGKMTAAPADPSARPPYGIAVKRPLLAAACKGCPWGALAFATAEAMKPYGYDVQVCWVCWSTYGPREVADKTKPVMPPADVLPYYIEPPPDGVPDFGITSDGNLQDAWFGRGAYASDNKPRRNFRVVATILQTNYMITAVSTKSGIKNLAEIRDRSQPTWLWIDGTNAATSVVLNYYGITEAGLKAKGGGIIRPTILEREKRASADVYIGGGLLVNTPEQHTWYEVTQLSDLVFLQMDDALIDQLLQLPGGYHRADIPTGYMRGVDRKIPTVSRDRHVIYVRDDAPDDFAYTVAKALDEHQELFRTLAQPYWYDPRVVATTDVIPLHPGAAKYYKERGYIK